MKASPTAQHAGAPQIASHPGSGQQAEQQSAPVMEACSHILLTGSLPLPLPPLLPSLLLVPPLLLPASPLPATMPVLLGGTDVAPARGTSLPLPPPPLLLMLLSPHRLPKVPPASVHMALKGTHCCSAAPPRHSSPRSSSGCGQSASVLFHPAASHSWQAGTAAPSGVEQAEATASIVWAVSGALRTGAAARGGRAREADGHEHWGSGMCPHDQAFDQCKQSTWPDSHQPTHPHPTGPLTCHALLHQAAGRGAQRGPALAASQRRVGGAQAAQEREGLAVGAGGGAAGALLPQRAGGHAGQAGAQGLDVLLAGGILLLERAALVLLRLRVAVLGPRRGGGRRRCTLGVRPTDIGHRALGSLCKQSKAAQARMAAP